MYCVYKKILFFLDISRFLDVANASGMPHLPRNLILMILLFYRTFLSCLEAENCVKFYFTMKILKNSRAAETAVCHMSHKKQNHLSGLLKRERKIEQVTDDGGRNTYL